MEKLKLFYTKYVNWIVIILFVCLGLKTCQSCSRERRVVYYQTQTTQTIDSLLNIIEERNKRIDSLTYELEKQSDRNAQIQREIKLLKETNVYFKQSNKKLIDNINKTN